MFKYHDYHKDVDILTIKVFIFYVRNKTKQTAEKFVMRRYLAVRAKSAEHIMPTVKTPQITKTINLQTSSSCELPT